MDKFIVIDQFVDTDDEKMKYPIGALYPRDGYTPSEERIKQLSTENNNKGVALIKKLIELPAKGAVDVETPESETVPVELDREAIKAELNAKGITFAKNAKTEILAEILAASKGE